MKNDEYVQVKVSSKYQIVIPKSIRNQLDLKPGNNLKLKVENNEIIAEKVDISKLFKKFYGSMPGAWGPDPVATIRKMREEEWR